MPYQNDMNSLADIVGPAYAAQQAGIQDAAANEKQQLENERYAGQNPAEIARPGLQNLFTQQQTASQQGVAQQEQAKGGIAQALAPGEIEVGKAKNAVNLDETKIQQFQQMGQIAGQVAGMMDNIPEAARPAAMRGLADKYGIDISKLGPLWDGNPDNLRSFRDKLIQGSADYQTKYMQEQSATERTLGAAQTQASGRVSAAEASAQARISAANINASMREKQQSFEQAAVQAAKAGHPDIAAAYTQAAQNLRQAQAGITAGLVGQQLPQPNFPSGGGQQQQPSAPNNTPAMVAQAKAIWPNDDPSKYDYRTGPDGNIQRKAK